MKTTELNPFLTAEDVTCLSDLNLFGHCFEPEPESGRIEPNEADEMLREDMQAESDYERAERDAIWEEMYEDRNF